MSFLWRRFSSHVISYEGNIFASSWVHVPVWNIYGAEKGYPHALKSFQEVTSKFPDGPLHVGEFCSVSCKNTLHIVTKLIKDLRTRSDREVIIHPTLLPTANWNEWFKLALSDQYYGSIPNVYLAASPGSIWKRLFAPDSLHFIYSNHSFMPLSKVRVADDHLWPTCSKDPEIKKELKQTSIKDYDTLLTLRHAELKKGGRFCFDVLLNCNFPKDSIWNQIHEVVTDFTASGKIKKEERDKMAIRNYERDDEIVDTVLAKHQKNFRVIEKAKIKSRFTAYNQYEIDKDAAKLAKTYTDWMKEWTAPAVLNGLGAGRSQQEKIALVDQVFTELEARCLTRPVALDVPLYDIMLEKI